jgi:hypothetical protein
MNFRPLVPDADYCLDPASCPVPPGDGGGTHINPFTMAVVLTLPANLSQTSKTEVKGLPVRELCISKGLSASPSTTGVTALLHYKEPSA